MFRMGLLTSTAMTAVALLLSGVPIAAHAQTDMHVRSRDPNTRFLCTYGQFQVSVSSAFHSGGQKISSGWKHVAVPVIGHGQTVTTIRVIEEQGQYTITPSFSAGIYSNTASGFPGQPIAVGTGSVGQSCGPVTISIMPTKLKRHTKYWIEETARTRFSCRSLAVGENPHLKVRPATCSGYSSSASWSWFADPYTKRRAYVQTHSWCKYRGCSSSYTSPWTEQSTGPYVKLE